MPKLDVFGDRLLQEMFGDFQEPSDCVRVFFRLGEKFRAREEPDDIAFNLQAEVTAYTQRLATVECGGEGKKATGDVF